MKGTKETLADCGTDFWFLISTSDGHLGSTGTRIGFETFYTCSLNSIESLIGKMKLSSTLSVIIGVWVCSGVPTWTMSGSTICSESCLKI